LYTLIGVVNKAITLSPNAMIAWGTAAATFLSGLSLAVASGLIYQQAPLRQQVST
jgi:hypothetical protein